jgi:hypothetical protein
MPFKRAAVRNKATGKIDIFDKMRYNIIRKGYGQVKELTTEEEKSLRGLGRGEKRGRTIGYNRKGAGQGRRKGEEEQKQSLNY